MKQLVILLLAIGVGFLGYLKAYPIIIDKLGIVIPKKVVVVEEVVEEVKPEPEAPKIEMPKEEPKPEPKPEAPKMVDEGLGKPTKKVDADGFELPEFPPIDEVTKNWTALPASSFPRQIKMNKSVDFVMTVGANKIGSKSNPGATGVALSQEGEDLVVAPSQGSNARGKIAISDTDIKELLTAGYENWKVQRTAALKQDWLRAKNAAAAPTHSTALSNAPKAAEATNLKNDKPTKARNGSYPLLLESMQKGQVTEVTEQNITKWEDPVPETVDGKNYWVVIVSYTTKTMFGDFPTAAKAYVHNGKVEKWIYRDSGEVVP